MFMQKSLESFLFGSHINYVEYKVCYYTCFSVVVAMVNRNRSKDYTISIILRVDTVLYTGEVKDAVKKEKFDRVIKAGTGKFFFVLTFKHNKLKNG